MNRRQLKPFNRIYIFRIAAACCILCSIFSIRSPRASAEISSPVIVRVGLNFAQNAVSQTAFTSLAGVEAGILENGTFSGLFQSTAGAGFKVSKDGYGAGPWHVLAASLSTFESALSDSETLKKSGFAAVPAYMGGWMVLSGSYPDQASAQAAATELSQKTGRTQVRAVSSISPTDQDRSASLLRVADLSGDLLFLFSDNIKTLVFRSLVASSGGTVPVMAVNGGPRYRGWMEVSRLPESDMTVVNILDMDDYLYGVVPAEIGASSPAEAIKAQAVVARTYATYQISLKKHAKYGFDLCNTVDCQSYKGYDFEGADCSRYIAETRGKIITYTYPSGPKAGQKELAQVFYFSTSGGHTESCENVWYATLPYLVGVEDPYEPKDLPYSNWTATLSTDQIIKMTGSVLARVSAVEVLRLTASGRVYEVSVRGFQADGAPRTLTFLKEQARTKFSLKSQWYRVDSDTYITLLQGSQTVRTGLTGNQVATAQGTLIPIPDTLTACKVIGAGGKTVEIPSIPGNFTFVGKGWGHGVGMSQNGAIGMAKAGIAYDAIIMHYFTGIKIE